MQKEIYDVNYATRAKQSNTYSPQGRRNVYMLLGSSHLNSSKE